MANENQPTGGIQMPGNLTPANSANPTSGTPAASPVTGAPVQQNPVVAAPTPASTPAPTMTPVTAAPSVAPSAPVQPQPQMAQPTPMSAPTQPMQPVQAPTQPMQPAPTPTPRPVQPNPGMGPRPGQPNMVGPNTNRPGVPPLGARKPPSTKRVLSWLVGCFGCSILLFVLLAVVFVAQTSSTGENAIARSLNVSTGDFINAIINIVNVVFSLFAIILFIVASVGIFRTAVAKKDDKEARKKGLTIAGAAGLLLTFLIFIWVGIYLFLSSRKVATPQTQTQISQIVTDPANTLGLTAPVTIKFDGTKLPINSRQFEIISFLWSFGDGETSTVQSPSHTYQNQGKNNGRFDVKVTVTLRNRTDSKESTQEFTTIVTIQNEKVTASFTASPEQGGAPLKVAFDASQSKAPAGEIQEYGWDFDNNNTFTDATGVKTEHTFEQVGKYTVQLRVTDNTGQFTVVAKDIEVTGPNIPTAVIDIPTTDGRFYAGIQYTLSGEKSTSPAGRILSYDWNFGDQTPNASSRTATHTFKNPGDYEITLTATDEKGGKGQTSKKITVEAAVGALLPSFKTTPAVSNNEAFISGQVPFEVSFDASSSAQTGGNIVDYKWDFDGNGTDDASGKQATFSYKQAGTYNATLTVYDANNKKASTILVVKVGEQGLQAQVKADPVEGNQPLTVVFDASGSTYPTGKIVSYEWDFGDNSPKQIYSSKITYKYNQIGTFTAKVKVTAADGTTSTATTLINVRPIALKACFTTTTQQGPAPLTIEFDPYCSAGTVTKYLWDFGDGETSRSRKPTHTFKNPGSYKVKLEASDNQNVIDTFTMDILVTGNVQ